MGKPRRNGYTGTASAYIISESIRRAIERGVPPTRENMLEEMPAVVRDYVAWDLGIPITKLLPVTRPGYPTDK